MKTKILVIHGPNLHLLGFREKNVYGTKTLSEINAEIKKRAPAKGISLRIFQSNSEGEIIDLLTKHAPWCDCIVINPAAYTHYSYAIRDALAAFDKPVVEVHLSDVSKREAFRKISVIKDIRAGLFCGEGLWSYLKAIELCLKLKK